VTDWVKAGGKLIAIERALNFFANKEGFCLKEFMTQMRRKRPLRKLQTHLLS